MRQKLDTTSKDQVWLFGQVLQRKILHSHQLRPGIYQHQDSVVFAPINSNKMKWQLQKEFDTKLETWLKRICRLYLAEKTQSLAKLMGVTYKSIRLKDMRSRWGSCSSLGNLNFNWRLIHLDRELIDHVIIHELAHRLELNHSHRFWEIVRKYDSQYRTHRRQLKQLELW